jgi:predicted Zn-dependent protease
MVVDGTLSATADITASVADTTDIGGVDQGVLGLTEMRGSVTFVSGWNYYAGADPSGITAGQFDFHAAATHELGHAVGLGHSPAYS